MSAFFLSKLQLQKQNRVGGDNLPDERRGQLILSGRPSSDADFLVFHTRGRLEDNGVNLQDLFTLGDILDDAIHAALDERDRLDKIPNYRPRNEHWHWEGVPRNILRFVGTLEVNQHTGRLRRESDSSAEVAINKWRYTNLRRGETWAKHTTRVHSLPRIS